MSRVIIAATWDDAPHLTKEAKDALWNSIPEFQRDARTKGIPQLGAGAIYPFSESQIRVPDMEIARHWVRAFALDSALSGTVACVWGALDRDTNILYITSIYKRSQAETAVHADAIKSRGEWIPGVGDAADIVDSDRTRFLDLYRRFGIDIELPDKSVETGIQEVYDRLSSGKLKVFASCAGWFEEFRLYHRDERGRVVKKNDHLMDCTRYLVKSGLSRAKTAPVQSEEPRYQVTSSGEAGLGWMH